MSKRRLHNLTPDRLKIESDSGPPLLIAPFGRDEIEDEKYSNYPIEQLKTQGLVSTVKEEEETAEQRFSNLLSLTGSIGFAVIIFLSVLSEKNPALATSLGYGIVFVGVIIFILLLVFFWKGRAVFQGWLRQALSLVLILGIGAGLPIYAYYQICGIGDTFSNWIVNTNEFGILLQLLFTIVVCLLPALLYFIFDRQLLGTLRDRFERGIFRLDDSMRTLQDVEAKYGRRLDEAFGSAVDPRDEARIAPGTRFPILVATVVITLGWLWVLMPDPTAGEATTILRSPNLFSPRQEAMNYAFLGAYFFMIGTVVRRYVRGDLKPKAYSSITVRIILAIIGAWVLEIMYGADNRLVLVLAFVVGFFPETLMVLIQEWLREKGIKQGVSSVQQQHPLTVLEGIDVYDRARLQDEGIVNIESLAHHDLIELMLETRIPLTRLIDWVDQAILYIHLSSPTTHSAEGGSALRAKIKQSGIRTATDLECSFELVGALARIRNPVGDINLLFDVNELAHIGLILDSMFNDDWLASIRHWRRTSQTDIRTRRIDSRGREITDSIPVVQPARSRVKRRLKKLRY